MSQRLHTVYRLETDDGVGTYAASGPGLYGGTRQPTPNSDGIHGWKGSRGGYGGNPVRPEPDAWICGFNSWAQIRGWLGGGNLLRAALAPGDRWPEYPFDPIIHLHKYRVPGEDIMIGHRQIVFRRRALQPEEVSESLLLHLNRPEDRRFWEYDKVLGVDPGAGFRHDWWRAAERERRERERWGERWGA